MVGGICLWCDCQRAINGVFHTDNHDQIFQRLDNLKFDTYQLVSTWGDEVATANPKRQREKFSEFWL